MKAATIKNPITPQMITVIITKTAVTAGLFFQKLDIEPEAAAADTGVKVGETVEVVGRSLDVADVVGSTRLLLLSVLLPVLVLVTMTNVVATNEVLEVDRL